MRRMPCNAFALEARGATVDGKRQERSQMDIRYSAQESDRDYDFLCQVEEDLEVRSFTGKPRVLPYFAGVRTLSQTEIDKDMRVIHREYNFFQWLKSKSKSGLQKDAATLLPKSLRKRHTRISGAESMEEAGIYQYRKALRLAGDELSAFIRERQDLERSYMGTRCRLIRQLEKARELKLEQDQILRSLEKEVLLLSSQLQKNKSRVDAIQSLIAALEDRRKRIVDLERENVMLRQAWKKSRQCGCTFKSEPEFLGAESSDGKTRNYLDEEQELKQKFLEQSNSKLNVDEASGSSHIIASGRARRYRTKSTSKHKQVSSQVLKKNASDDVVVLLNFRACSIPIVPYDAGLLLSPLGILPDQVVAASPTSLQWMPSLLPQNMQDWEKERYETLQMKAEVERLRFQLRRAQNEKLDAQQHAKNQIDSIKLLMSQIDQLRDSSNVLSKSQNTSDGPVELTPSNKIEIAAKRQKLTDTVDTFGLSKCVVDKCEAEEATQTSIDACSEEMSDAESKFLRRSLRSRRRP